MANIDAIFDYENDPNDNYYSLLGCTQLSTCAGYDAQPDAINRKLGYIHRYKVEQIITEYKVRALLYHPDKNPNDAQSAKKFAKLQVAKDILTCEESRMKYDKWLNAGLHMPFEVWNSHNSHIHSSLHWANPKPKSMIESTQPNKTKDFSSLNVTTPQNTSSLLQKFRNYEI